MVFHDADALLQVRYEAAVSRKESAKMSAKRERRAGTGGGRSFREGDQAVALINARRIL